MINIDRISVYLSGVECVVAGREPGLRVAHVDAGQQPVLADHLEVLTQGGGGARGRGGQGLPHIHPPGPWSDDKIPVQYRHDIIML